MTLQMALRVALSVLVLVSALLGLAGIPVEVGIDLAQSFGHYPGSIVLQPVLPVACQGCSGGGGGPG
jgi:hypothetical protein